MYTAKCLAFIRIFTSINVSVQCLNGFPLNNHVGGDESRPANPTNESEFFACVEIRRKPATLLKGR